MQYAFNILLIRGILPFTALIAFRCVLHRYLEPRHPSLKVVKMILISDKIDGCKTGEHGRPNTAEPISIIARDSILGRCRHNKFRFVNWIRVMILPQVHLRKPCYDFSFL